MDLDDFAHRELCPDGACVGVLGPDGRCKLCGTIGPGEVRDPRLAFGASASAGAAASAPEPAAPASGEASDDDLERRQLCPDGACLGVVADGRCNLCGKPAGARA
jgi:hypothetical protein